MGKTRTKLGLTLSCESGMVFQVGIKRDEIPLPVHATSQVSYEFKKNRSLKHFYAAKATASYLSLVQPLMNRFGYDESDLLREFLRYNLKINEEDNNTYQKIGTQFALLVNYLPSHTWFSHRLDRYSCFVRRFKTIADIGFGIPFPWLSVALGYPSWEGKYQFVDSSQSAIDFAIEFIQIVQTAHASAAEMLSFTVQRGSVEKYCDWKLKRPEAIVSLDCIEHANSAQQCLSGIGRMYRGAAFLIGLPVGTPIPQHTIDFDSEADALDFVRGAGMRIVDSNLVPAAWERDIVGNVGFKGSIFIESI